MPKKVDHELRREDLAKAAFRLIADNGLAGATLREVAREAGCSHGTIRHYIKSKEELLLAAASYHAALTRARLDEIEQHYRGVEALRRTLLALLPLEETDIGYLRVWFAFWEGSLKSAPVKAVIEGHHGTHRERIERLIRQAQKLGELPHGIQISMAAGMAQTLIAGVGIQIYMGGRELVPPKQQRNYIERWFDTALKPS